MALRLGQIDKETCPRCGGERIMETKRLDLGIGPQLARVYIQTCPCRREAELGGMAYFKKASRV